MDNIKTIPGYEGLYGITTDGQVWSYTANKWLATHYKKGYEYCHLLKNGKDSVKAIHRLVAETYIPNPHNKPTVDHIDRNPSNNNIDNLRWATVSEQNINRTWTEARQEAANKGGKAVSKPVEMRDKNDHSIIIRTFPSSLQAAIEMFNDKSKNSLINRCANGNKASAYGYYWTFVQENDSV